MAQHNNVGNWGEKIACEYLIGRGYTILEQNWRMHHLEVDIVAMKGQYVAFVEVKTRTDRDEDPVLAVDSKKINRLVRAANVYMQMKRLPHFCRFDIFTVVGEPDDYEVEHLIDAFPIPLKSFR